MVFTQREPERAEPRRVELTPQQTQQIRDLARAVGADPEFLLGVLRNAEVRRSGDHYSFSYGLPNRGARTGEESRATDLGLSILSRAYQSWEGDRRVLRTTPDFSAETLGGAAADYLRNHGSFQIGAKTGEWLRREAVRLGVDAETLRRSIRTYYVLRNLNPTVANNALREVCGNDPKIEAFAMACADRLRTRETESGGTELWLRTADAVALRGEFRAEEVMRSTPRRLA
ncbi:MAG: hypothetical protein V1861_06205 [Candidatus Micrarchaeota archaeon]